MLTGYLRYAAFWIEVSIGAWEEPLRSVAERKPLVFAPVEDDAT
jgi:hypothetical protein